MPEQHGPAAFADILNSPERPLIVGGQAVNVWAEYFAPRNPQVAALRPFVSKDADIYADRATAEKIAAATGWQIRFFHEPRTIAVAVLTQETPAAGTLTVEVLRSVRGLTARELADADVVELRPGQSCRIPSPIRLLKAKLANLAEIKPPRPQDAHHVRLLCLLTAEYLKEQHAQVAGKRLAERILINALNELHRLNTTPSARRLEKQFGLPLGLALPLDLSAASLPKLAAFYRHLTPP